MAERLITTQEGLWGDYPGWYELRNPDYRPTISPNDVAGIRYENARLLTLKALGTRSYAQIQKDILQFDVSKETIRMFQTRNLPYAIEHVKRASDKGLFGTGINVGSFGRILTGAFTLGLSELQFNGERLGVSLRLEPYISGLVSGGNIVQGAKSETEATQFGLAFKTGTAVAAVGALTAGSNYSLSGGLNKFGTSAPASLTPLQSTSAPLNAIQSTLQKSGIGLLTTQAAQTFVGFTGNIGASVLRILSGDILGGLQQILNPPKGPSTVPGTTPTSTPVPFGNFGGGGGGSGLGVSTSGNTGLAAINPVWYVIGGLGLIGLLVWVLRRKT